MFNIFSVLYACDGKLWFKLVYFTMLYLYFNYVYLWAVVWNKVFIIIIIIIISVDWRIVKDN